MMQYAPEIAAFLAAVSFGLPSIPDLQAKHNAVFYVELPILPNTSAPVQSPVLGPAYTLR
jgi:hypothetical protein